MDIIESIKKDKAYLKSKNIVKNWEKEFTNKHSRRPSKLDIKEAPSEIRYAYKKYFHLKSAALETSLCCDLLNDSINSPEMLPSLENSGEPLSPDLNPLLQSLPTGPQLEKMLSNVEILPIKNKVVEDKSEASPFTRNLSKKLFVSKKFSIRNPRKMGNPKSAGRDETINGSLTNESCTEEILQTKLTETQNEIGLLKITSSKSILNDNDTASMRHIDKGWLERATGLKIDMEPNAPVSIPKDNQEIHDYVDNSESDTDDVVLSKLKPALKKRKISSAQPKSRGKNTIENSSQKNISSKDIENIENVNLDSTNPDEGQNPLDISEFVPFGIEKDVVPRIVDVSSAFQSSNIINTNNSSATTNSQMEKLEKKVRDGTLNDNYVKINIEKKVFARGKKVNNYSKYKKQQWKNKKSLNSAMDFAESGKILCFKCNASGHMARYCNAHKKDTLLPLDNYSEDVFASLEDMENIDTNTSASVDDTEEMMKSLYQPSNIPQSFLKLLENNNKTNNSYEINAIYSDLSERPQELYDALSKFGHSSFRPGQEEAIMRILCGMSTLLILSTGGGKSLCYQLPAYLYSLKYKCVTLVISPLISLMEDQVLNMPEFLKAGCLHSNQSPTQRQKIIQCLRDGNINILLISPETLCSADSSNGFSSLYKSMPPIAFACIDEIHCISQWSHNFRPSYLTICRVLKEKLKIKCILGLTATASKITMKSVVKQIDVPDGMDGVITNPTLPENLLLSVSLEKNKDQALLNYLRSEKISQHDSIIVYCLRRDECERIAAMLRASLQEQGKVSMEAKTRKRKRMSYLAESYHAGLSPAQRKKIQKHFMDGSIRIIVATIAFGMGIDKSDIRCIVHFNLPSSFESYVQEVGRAGRDGKLSHCHAFMSNQSNDKSELLKHIYANTIDRATIRKLIQKVFVSCQCKTINADTRCLGHEVGIPIDETVEELDTASENLSTLLCYLELHPSKYITVLNNSYTKCKIISYGGVSKIVEAAKSCPPLAMAILKEKKEHPNFNHNILEFNAIDIASAIGWDSGLVKYHLKKP